MIKKLTPSDMQSKVTPIKIAGHYNWKKQVFEENTCKWGTNSMTSRQTCSGQNSWVDDFPMDSYTD